MAASATPPGVVDPTKPAKYPVILSDALLGKSPKEILTAIRHNHKPTDTTSGKLKPGGSSSSSYNLTYDDDKGGKYAYAGTRAAKENQYVLVFDPERKAFVLHRVDALYNMNVTRTPTNPDAEGEYPRIGEGAGGASGAGGAGRAGDKKSGKNAAGKNAKSAGMVENKRAGPKKKENAPAAAASASKTAPSTSSSSAKAAAAAAAPSSPTKKEQQKSKKRSFESEEEDDSDDDGGLLVEYPDPVEPSHGGRGGAEFSPAFPSVPIRRFADFVDSGNDDHDDDDDGGGGGDDGMSDADADAEYDEDDLLVEGVDEDSAGDGFKLPSPVGRNNQQNDMGGNGGGGDDGTPEDDEQELMAMLEEEMGQGMADDSESSVSEED